MNLELTELSKKVYQLQIDKGWCKPNEKRDIEDLKILILSEAFEAFEAFRGGKYTNPNNLHVLKAELGIYDELTDSNHKKEVLNGFKEFVKDTFEDEIADVAIRALDLAGYLELDFRLVFIEDIKFVFAKKEDFPSILRELTSRIHRLFNRGVDALDVLSIIRWCELCANVFDFDLMLHIELKLAYNKTRAFRHGGKVV
jgi:NTP pyrophosphatase (non-canonical NTP hydrolase)